MRDSNRADRCERGTSQSKPFGDRSCKSAAGRARILLPSITLVALAAFLSYPRAAIAHEIPFPSGMFSATFKGSFNFCLDPNYFQPDSCQNPDALAVGYYLLDTGTITFDSKGNGCSANTEVDNLQPLNSALPPWLVNVLEKFSPTVIPTEHEAITTLDYDPATGTGDMSEVIYNGSSASCDGATLEPNGEQHRGAFDVHFAVSDGGNRIDFVATKLTDPNGQKSYGGVAFFGFAVRQASPEGEQ